MDCLDSWDGRLPGEIFKNSAPAFRDQSRELTRAEYTHLVGTARDHGKERLALLMETVCSTGIRVSEVPYITVETARVGPRRDCAEGEDSGHFAAGQALPEALEVRPET